MKLGKKQLIGLVILLGIFGYFAGVGVYEKYFNNEIPTQQIQQNNSDNTENIQPIRQGNSLNKLHLDGCLDNVNKNFSDFSDDYPNLTTEEYQIVLETRQNEIENCYRRYPIN